jgi:hypothetical protein
VNRVARSIATLAAGTALLAVALPALAAEPPAGVAFDGVVTVVFHDPAYDNGNGIEGADVALTVIDLATPDVPIQELQGTTDAGGAATFTDVARPLDPGIELELQVTAVRDRTFVDPDGCTVAELLVGTATAPAGLDVTIDVEVVDQQGERTCPPPVEGPPIIVEGTAVDPDGDPMEILYADAVLGTEALPIETTDGGAFRVEVPATTDPSAERELSVVLISPDVRTIIDDPEPGCQTTWALSARGTWTLVGNEAPEPTTLVAVEDLFNIVCPDVAPPGPSGVPNPTPPLVIAPNPIEPSAAPDTTLPPTDTGTNVETERGGAPAAVFLVLFAIGLASTVAARRASRRDS